MDCVVRIEREKFWRQGQQLYQNTGGSVAAFCCSRGHVESHGRTPMQTFLEAKPLCARYVPTQGAGAEINFDEKIETVV
jgi:hypothetical protein